MNTPELYVTKNLVANIFPYLEWRLHGLGVLQAYLVEGGDEIRIHIWHPDLVVMAERPHNHRFHLYSQVLLGEIDDHIYWLRPAESGRWFKHAITHYRNASGDKGKDIALLSPRGHDARVQTRKFSAGSAYELPKGMFHVTKVDGLAVTIITKTEQTDDKAVVLGPKDGIPSAVSDVPAVERFKYLIDEAEEALRS